VAFQVRDDRVWYRDRAHAGVALGWPYDHRAVLQLLELLDHDPSVQQVNAIAAQSTQLAEPKAGKRRQQYHRSE
jgi:hypothetical protein